MLLVSATSDPRQSSINTYNAAVANWTAPDGGYAQFAAGGAFVATGQASLTLLPTASPSEVPRTESAAGVSTYTQRLAYAATSSSTAPWTTTTSWQVASTAPLQVSRGGVNVLTTTVTTTYEERVTYDCSSYSSCQSCRSAK